LKNLTPPANVSFPVYETMGVNQSGQIVGTFGCADGNGIIPWCAYEIASNGAFTALSTSAWSSAGAINDSGDVAGWIAPTGFAPFVDPFEVVIWSHTGQTINLSSMSSVPQLGYPVAINSKGQVLGAGGGNLSSSALLHKRSSPFRARISRRQRDRGPGPVQVQVTNSFGTSPAFTVNQTAIMPEFLVANYSTFVSATHANGTPVTPVGSIPGVTSSPAAPGETISLYGTGLGPVVGSPNLGQLLTSPVQPSGTVTVTVAGMPCTVTWAGMSENGLDQINVTLPASLPTSPTGIEAVIAASVNGMRSCPRVFRWRFKINARTM
jgi:uncharacterized protein (TIGR03437 family)